MAKTRMVTRTIKTYEVTVIALSLATYEVSSVKYTLDESHGNTTEEKILKYIQKTYDNEELKNVSILSINETEKLYGMTETDFIKYGEEIPPRFID